MTIENLIQRDGFTLIREAGTNSGELSGPCPFCGGKDRFRVWPEKGRYWCRQCGAQGDSIQYLRDKRGMTYREACDELGKDPLSSARVDPSATLPKLPKPNDGWLCLPWQKAAWAFLERCRADLQRSSGAMAYLKGRGLNDGTIAHLGLNARTTHVERDAWGLPAGKKIWLPRGIVIPSLDRALIHRLRIRLHQDEFEKSKSWTKGRGIKYAEISGSGNDPLLLPGRDRADAWAVVESELDAYLIHQEAGDMVHVLGLGSTTGRPTAETLRSMAGKRVLLCLDCDAAGWNAADGLPGQYWPSPIGKDPGEYSQAGGDIRLWIKMGVHLNAPPQDIVGPDPLQEVEGPVQDDAQETIGSGEGLSLPGDSSNITPGSIPGDCTRRGCLGDDPCEWAWFEGGAYVCLKDGHRLWHPDDLPPISAYDRQQIEMLERQRAEQGLDPGLGWIYGVEDPELNQG